MNILVWHIHGSWMTSFVQGPHTYLVPTLPDRGADGLGRARTWDWPPSVIEVGPDEARHADIDVVVLQRPRELNGLAEAWTGRRPGRDLPAVYVEHSTPETVDPPARHPLAEHPEVPAVHVTHFNRLFWDTGAAPTTVIEHGIPDPGDQYKGDLARGVFAANDAIRRRWVMGTDLLPAFRRAGPVDIYGIGAEALGGADLPQHALHEAMARRRVYLHPVRWTSLGLTLLEAMALGMPVVALATTEVGAAVAPGAGVVSNDLGRLTAAFEDLLADPDQARAMGAVGRAATLEHYGLGRFLADWNRLLEEVTR